MSNNNTEDGKITIHFSLTSSPSTPRVTEVIDKDTKASQLRTIAAKVTNIPQTSIKLIFRGRIIQNDDNSLAHYKVEDGCVIHCLGKPVAPTKIPESSGVSVGTTATVSTPSVAVASSSSDGNRTSNNQSPSLEGAMKTLKTQNAASIYTTALTTLLKVISNILSNPNDEKYRKLKQSNAAFGRRLGNLTGGHDAMISVGFTVETPEGMNDPHYVLKANADAWNHLLQCKGKVEKELDEHKRSQSSSTSTPSSYTPTMPSMGGFGSGNMPNLPNMSNMPPMTPFMQQQMSNLMSDPNAMQNLMQSPMVQQMIQNDPRVANNPMLRQALNDPNTMSRITQMMSDPAVRQMMSNPAMMQTLMNQMPGMGGMSGGMPQTPTPTPTPTTPSNQQPDPAALARMMQGFAQMQSSNTSSNSSQQQSQQSSSNMSNTNSVGNTNNNSGDSEAMTEEEMIAEAIARSLRES